MDTAPDTDPPADDASSTENLDAPSAGAEDAAPRGAADDASAGTVDAPSASSGDEASAAPVTDVDQAPADAAPDGLGGPGTGTDDGAAASTVLAVGLPEAAEQRLLGSGRYEVVHDPAEADTADVVLLSTRLPRMEAQQALRTARRASEVPVVALVHTGGELVAAEVMRAGGSGVIAEGNEEALGAFLTGDEHDGGQLVASYERYVTPSRGRPDPRHGRDDATHLPGGEAFDQRLVDLVQAAETPRVGFLRVLNLPELGRQLSRDAVLLLRLRLAVQFRHIALLHDVELFALSDTDFGFVSATLTPPRAEELGSQLALVTQTYAPSGAYTLALAMGHAGGEVSQDPGSLRELAHRALEVAASQKESAVVSADTLSLDGSSTTELETATRILALVESQDAFPPGHGARVAAYVGELARHLGYEGAARTRLQLAAHLHDVGKIGLPAEAVAGPRGLSEPALAAYREHAERGAEYLRVSAGVEVAAAVRSHHERWDGGGFPDGLRGDDIPLGGRLIAVADAFEHLLHGLAEDGGAPLSVADAANALRAAAGTWLDPDLAEVAATVLPPLAAELASAAQAAGSACRSKTAAAQSTADR